MAWTVIQHLSAPTSDQLSFSGLDLSAYNLVRLELSGVTVGTDGAFVRLRLSTASTVRTSGYRWAIRTHSSSGSSEAANSETGTEIPLLHGSTSAWGVGNAAGESGSSSIIVSNVSSSLYKMVTHNGASIGTSGSLLGRVGAGTLEQTGSVDGLLVYLSTGTMTAGKATLYGLPTS